MSSNESQAAWRYEVVPQAQPYYYRTDLALALRIAKEMVEEWDYHTDAHGYCHERSVLVRLIEALEDAPPSE